MRRDAKREQINVWRLDEPAGIELRSGVAVTAPYPRHWHEEYQLCFIQSGGGELFYRGAHHPTPATSLFIVHPGEVHSNHTLTGCSFSSLYIAPELIAGNVSDVASRQTTLPFFPDPLVFDPEILDAYAALVISLEHRAAPFERESALLELLAQLVTRRAQERPRLKASGKEHAAVRKVRERLIEDYAQSISLEELARLVNLSPFHLTRVFTREIGMPPHAFQTQVRIAHAKKLIRAGLPLSRVAATTGFADQSHFIRHFKRLLKITPGEYSKNSNNVQYASPHAG